MRVKKNQYLFVLLFVVVVLNSSMKIISTKNFFTKGTNLIVTKDSLKTKYNYFESTKEEEKWVDSVYTSLTLEEKIGQLIFISAYSKRDEQHFKELEQLIEKYKVGGLLFLQGSAVKQAKLTNRLQAKSKIPLFITIDAEWGLKMRLDSTFRYPYNMALGAIKDTSLIVKMGKLMGKECKRMGVHFNFAPVTDINTNPLNPIIGNRSFGENKENVIRHALALMKGVQSEGVFSTAKHFPGHGDTEVDSHLGLPVLKFDRQRLDSIEMFPYKPLFEKGLQSVMVAHLNVPVLEEKEGYPTSASYKVTTELLQHQLGFKGLIFTDGLNMKGASNFKKSGDLELECFLAGNDVLLNPVSAEDTFNRLKLAYEDSIITEERLKHSVTKILKFKYKAGLNKYEPIEIENLVSDLNPVESTSLVYQLYENAITVIQNKKDILPIKDLAKNKIAYLELGDDSGARFLETLSKYSAIKDISEFKKDSIHNILEELKDCETVIISYHKSEQAWWKPQDFSAEELLLFENITKEKKVILDVFAKPYVLSKVNDLNNIDAVIVSYQNGEIAQQVSAEIIFGAIEAKGKLPVSISNDFKEGIGINTKKIDRLGFTIPENVGLNSYNLAKIDTIINYAIENNITPGAQILVARKGKVVYQKSFGYQAYDKSEKIKNTDLYDIASLTKIVATLPNIMIDYDQKKIHLDTRLKQMVPQTKGTDKEKINFKELLSHYARLKAWEPFYKSTLDSITKKPSAKYYKHTHLKGFTEQVVNNMFISKDYNDSIIKKIVESKLLKKKEYVYSDFTFILLKEYLEKKHRKSLDVLTEENYFSKIGMNNTTYNPLQKFDICSIVPTEEDNYFRFQRIHGYVHDMAAAMQGGVGGHAGVFSNALDVAKMMQMYLQKGKYGGIQFFSEKTFNDFNTCYFCENGNRRGLGFDKQQEDGKPGPTCGCASITSFGHTGFTGTMTWADPEEELIYVFLSNRTYPDSTKPNTLSKENIREKIQEVIYESIIR